MLVRHDRVIPGSLNSENWHSLLPPFQSAPITRVQSEATVVIFELDEVLRLGKYGIYQLIRIDLGKISILPNYQGRNFDSPWPFCVLVHKWFSFPLHAKFMSA